MNFFKLQNRAKTQTFWFITLFCIGLIIVPFIGAKIIFHTINLLFFQKSNLPLPLFEITLVSFTLTILLVSLYKYISLQKGGKVIAVSLGGRLIDKKAANLNERKLLNIIEEMSIASSLPVPHVYILDNELNINAFAAGYSINDAVIGVTRGSIELLTRDELQAVIAHEFSHILNGDMRLNLRFSALLFGFIFVTQAGYTLFNLSMGPDSTEKQTNYAGLNKHTLLISKDREKKQGVSIHFVILAFALIAAGFLGQIWARVMQAAVNRQREYLADASSVQFTRHASALASALKKIGGSEGEATLKTAMTATYSHFFFGQADFNLLATHPPLKKRIKRIEPWWLGQFIKPDFSKIKQEGPTQTVNSLNTNQSIQAKQLATAIAVGVALSGNDTIPYIKPVSLLNTNVSNEQEAMAKLDTICQEPMDACYLMFALVLDTIPSIRIKQFKSIKNTELVTDYYQTLSFIPKEKYLMFIEKAIPSLKNLSETQYKDFKNILMHFIQADTVISLHEWLLYQLITHQVDGQFNPKAIIKGVTYHNLDQLKTEAETLLSAIAYLTERPMAQKQAFGLGANIMGLYTIQLQESPSISQLSTSLNKLQHASENVRRIFLQGVLRAIEQDQQISTEEYAFFRVLSLCLDCPIAISPSN